jgi:hypothetical protein
VLAHGNAARALRALDGLVTSIWHGWGVVHDGSGAWASRGIGRWGKGKVDGEVMAREGISGVLTKHGIHGGHGDALGERGVTELRRCGVGSSEESSRSGDRPLGVGLIE